MGSQTFGFTATYIVLSITCMEAPASFVIPKDIDANGRDTTLVSWSNWQENEIPSTSEMTLTFKPIWKNGTCSFEVIYLKIASPDRHQVEELAENAGDIRNGSIWTSVTGRSAFSGSLSSIGLRLWTEYGQDNPRSFPRLLTAH